MLDELIGVRDASIGEAVRDEQAAADGAGIQEPGDLLAAAEPTGCEISGASRVRLRQSPERFPSCFRHAERRSINTSTTSS